jgi:hypothetical protein
MTDTLGVSPLQTLVAQQTSLQSTLFAANSRCAGIGTATLSLPQGKTIIYLLRRFLPLAERFQLLQEHTVTQGERLDNITAQFMGDPTLFWRLCDANNAMRPEELIETIGRELRITCRKAYRECPMLKGVHLTLTIGPLVPIPVPQVVMDSLTSVEVTTGDGDPSGFKLSFTISNKSLLQTLFLLGEGKLLLFLRVIIVVTLNGTPDVIMDGVITEHQIIPGSDASHSTLTLMGKDLTALMDNQDFSGFPFPATPAEGRVALLLAKYAILGIVPLIVPSILIDVQIPTNSIQGQRGTDLAYIKALAGRVGMYFIWIRAPRRVLTMPIGGRRSS